MIQKLKTVIPKVFTHNLYNYHISSLRNLLLGVGLAYAVEKESYMHIPLVVIFPTPYAGYHAYSNKDNIINWFGSKFKFSVF